MINLEIKIKIDNISQIRDVLKNIHANYQFKMKQKDTYFQLGENKIKTREINGSEIQLITYFRREIKGKKVSSYSIKNMSKAQKNSFLKKSVPVCEVYKKRELWIYKNTRIHLDQVKGLGKFLELETVLKDISKKEGDVQFNTLIGLLDINKNDSIPYSYSDMKISR